MRVYFIGSHSVGKTTCARWVSTNYRLPMLPEVARQVMAEMELRLDSLRVDIDLVNRYQKTVFERQLSSEKAAGDNYVSDRAFDNLAYAAEHALVLKSIMASDYIDEYVRHVSKGIIFFVRPHISLMSNDGIREAPIWEGITRIDGMIKLLLEMWGVDYVPLASPSMQERVRTISFVLNHLEQGNESSSPYDPDQ